MSRTVFNGAGASVFEDEGALGALFEDEATTLEGPYGAGLEAGSYEDEWSPEQAFEDEWVGEQAFEDEWSPEQAFEEEWSPEQAFEEEWSPEQAFEQEWVGEQAYEEEWSPEQAYEEEWSPEQAYEEEWSPEQAYEEEWVGEQGQAAERDQFLPFLLPLAKLAIPAIKSLLPVAKKAVGSVVRSVIGGIGRPGRRPASPPVFRPPPGLRVPAPAAPSVAPPPAAAVPPPTMPAGPGGMAGPSMRPGRRRRRDLLVARLLRRLASILSDGETAAAETEAALFGGTGPLGEVAPGDRAHEAALTEVLAAEAAHTTDLGEAEALLGASLPVTIRIMGGRQALRSYMPELVRANSRLVAGMAYSDPRGTQLLRLGPCVHRRVIGSLLAAQRSGRRLPPSAVAPLMAGHAARVLGSPRIAGPALLRNTAIRQRTVAPARTRAPRF